jgi:hypothetical protein
MRGQSALADTAQAVHGLRNDSARFGWGFVQACHLSGTPHEQPWPVRQVR